MKGQLLGSTFKGTLFSFWSQITLIILIASVLQLELRGMLVTFPAPIITPYVLRVKLPSLLLSTNFSATTGFTK
jgi:hypothetical protein